MVLLNFDTQKIQRARHEWNGNLYKTFNIWHWAREYIFIVRRIDSCCWPFVEIQREEKLI